MTTMHVNRIQDWLTVTLFLTLTYTSSVMSASYPDFTEIVEQNMPAVVIVNATKTVTNPNGQNQFQSPPGMPDEFNDLF